MRYFLDPFVLEDPQSKREIYRQYQQRQNNRCDSRPQCHPSPSMGRGCWEDPILMDAIAHSHHANQQCRRQKRDHEPSCKRFQGDGLDFLVLPPEALQGGVKSRNPFKGRTAIRKPCQVPSPSPTRKAPPATPEKSTTKTTDIDPFFELLFGGGAPSDRSQRQDCRSAKNEQAGSKKSLDDELFELFFPGAKPRAHREQQQDLRQEALNQAILQKELEQRSAASAASRRQQQVRRQQSHEQAMQEAILRSMFGQQPSAMAKKDASNPTGEQTGEQKKSDRNVAFASNSTSAYYQLPQQWHTEATEEGLVLSIDVTGFTMDDLNLQVDPIRRGSAQLSLTGKRTNALGEVWELKRTKSLNAERYQINAVEATCEDDSILRITIPKKVTPTTSQVYIPIRPAATNNKQQEKANTEDVKPFTHFARSNEATRDTTIKAESKVEGGGNKAKDEGSITLEELLQAMVDQFERAYHESTPANPEMTSRESETKQQVNDNKELFVSTRIETEQETQKEKSEGTLKTSPAFDAEDVAAVKSETEENLLPESKPERLVKEPQRKSSSDEAGTSTAAEPITEKAEDDQTAETEIVWSRVGGFESTREEDTAAEANPPTDHARKDSNFEKNQPKSDEFFAETESFDILESEDTEDNQSWEDVDGFEREA